MGLIRWCCQLSLIHCLLLHLMMAAKWQTQNIIINTRLRAHQKWCNVIFFLPANRNHRAIRACIDLLDRNQPLRRLAVLNWKHSPILFAPDYRWLFVNIRPTVLHSTIRMANQPNRNERRIIFEIIYIFFFCAANKNSEHVIFGQPYMCLHIYVHKIKIKIKTTIYCVMQYNGIPRNPTHQLRLP